MISAWGRGAGGLSYPASAPSGRASSGFEEMCAIRWSAASRIERDSSRNTVSDGLCPGRCRTRSVRSRSCSCDAVGERPGDLDLRAPRAEAGRNRPQRRDDFRRDAVAQHHLLGEAVFEIGLLAVARQEGRERARAPPPRRPSAARGSTPARSGPCAGGVMTSSSRSSTAWPRAASACSSSSSALAEFGPESTSVSGESSIR